MIVIVPNVQGKHETAIKEYKYDQFQVRPRYHHVTSIIMSAPTMEHF